MAEKNVDVTLSGTGRPVPVEGSISEPTEIVTPTSLTPSRFTQQEVEDFRVAFQDYEGGPDKLLAQTLAKRVGVDSPDLFTYDTLSDGTAKIFDMMPSYKDQAPEDRKFGDYEIIQLLARDAKGNKLESGTLLGGFKREIIPSSTSAGGAVAGAKFGARLPGPPQVKFGGSLVFGLLGALGAYEGGEEVADYLLDEEMLMTPGTTAAYESGKTAASVAGWLPTPFLISKNVQFGAAQYLDNLLKKPAVTRTGPPTAAELAEPGVKQLLRVTKPTALYGPRRLTAKAMGLDAPDALKKVKGRSPRDMRFISSIERLLTRTGQEARDFPRRTVAAEVIAGSGAAAAVYQAEKKSPGQTGTRIGAEIAGGVAPGFLVSTATKRLPALKTIVQDSLKRFREGGVRAGLSVVKTSQQARVAEDILKKLEAFGEDPKEVIAKLEQGAAVPKELEELTDFVFEALTGDVKSSALKSGSPALMAIEANLAAANPSLSESRRQANESYNKYWRRNFEILVRTGDQESLQQASIMLEDLFQSGLKERLTNAADNVLSSFKKVKGSDPELNTELSQRLYDSAQTNVGFARNTEKQLWGQVGNQVLEWDPRGDLPNFIENWEKALPKDPDLRKQFNKMLPGLDSFVTRRKKQLGFGDSVDSVQAINTPKETDTFNAFYSKSQGTNARSKFDFQMSNLDLSDGPTDANIEALGKLEADIKLGMRRLTPDAKETAQKNAQLVRLKRESLIAEKNFLAPKIGDDGDMLPLDVEDLQGARSLAIKHGRKLLADSDPDGARVAFSFADAILKDLDEKMPEGASAAYQVARAFSRALNDTYTRAFAGDILAVQKSGAERLSPELLAHRLLQGGSDPTLLRIQELRGMSEFAEDALKTIERTGISGTPEDPIFTADVVVETAKNLDGTIDKILRNARAASMKKVRNPETGVIEEGRIDPVALQNWIEQNQQLLDLPAFTQLRDDLLDSQKANALLSDEFLNNKKVLARHKAEINFQNLLPENAGSPTYVAGKAITDPAPEKALGNLIGFVNKLEDPELRASAMTGLRSSILDYVMTKGGKTSDTFSPKAVFQELFKPMKNVVTKRGTRTRRSLAEFMVDEGVMTENQKNALSATLKELVKLEAADARGDLVEMAKGANAAFDLYLRIQGSKLGASLSEGSDLIARSAGSKFLRNIFQDMPAIARDDVLIEMMENPKLLAQMLKKPASERERLQIGTVIGDYLKDLGFTPIRRVTPSVIRETGDEINEPTEVGPVSSVAPTAMPAPEPVPAQRVAPPTSTLASATPVAPPPAASGPVNRAQYAALFPNDIASGMIQQQGTALMADGGAVRHLAAGGRADGPGSDNFGSEASQHGSGGGYSGNDGAGDQNQSMTPEERYADNARRLGQTYISDDQNQSMTPEERYADNFARLSANLPQSIPSNSAVSLTITPQEKRQVLSQVNKVAQQSLQPDAVIDFRQRLAAGQFDPQKAALNPAQARAAALNPTLAGFVQPGADMGITSLPSIQTNTNMEQPTVAPEASFSGLPVGEGKLMGQYDPATGKVELVYTRQYARGGAVNLGIGNLFRRRV